MCEHASIGRTRSVAAVPLCLLAVLGLSSCDRAAPVAGPVAIAPEPVAVEPEPACETFAGIPGDVDLRGLARTHAPRCCPSRYGFDPELVRAGCGFVEYLGESEELACVHRFRDAAAKVHELRLTPLVDLEFADAVALHESGEFGPEYAGAPLAELPALWSSAAAGRRWVLVPGWSIIRRLAWDEAACSVEDMLPVLARMQEARDDPAAGVALPRLVEPPAEPELAAPSLLTLDFARATTRRYPLPRAAPQLVHDLLAAAVADDLQRFASLLDGDARIGLPDRRQLGAHAIIDADAARRRLLAAAARLARDTPLRCPRLDRRVAPQVARGELPMWCFWLSEDGLDLLAVGLRGRVVDGWSDAAVSYLGLFPARPAAPVELPGEPPPPPVVPVPTLVCSDPHSVAYPELCPPPEPSDTGDVQADEDDEAP